MRVIGRVSRPQKEAEVSRALALAELTWFCIESMPSYAATSRALPGAGDEVRNADTA